MRTLLSGLALAVTVLAVVALPRLMDRLFVDDFDFVALDDPAGFRRIAAGDVSAGFDPLTGEGLFADPPGDVDAGRGQGLCRALFGPRPLPRDSVPIAYFSDYQCPYCRVLSERLATLEEEVNAARVTWHEWPVLGKASEVAARAALAARRQGAYAEFHTRLIQSSFIATPAYLRSIAEEVGIDADRLLEDMNSAGVEREIAKARALAARFGFSGTPGLVVGRTAVVGAISEGELRKLVELEIAEGPVDACDDLYGAEE